MTKDTNDRYLSAIDIINLQQDPATEEFVLKKVGVFNPVSETVWTFYEPGIVYPDGTPTPIQDVFS
jgi:hypothetical protein